ncbi:DNA-directed RNA polymerase III subunit RPC7 [Brachionichthys hirsutus]|uniref:DNA-directed RNA polymerase III subunit RPC7 n=1 Tax=Brachionichthys hirsutus TaxID=412623 RepID=UPI0036052B2E
MAGRGRGVAAFSFNVEALGIGRGSMPEARVGPGPLFPNTDYKPVPLKAGEDEDYMLALKQEMRGTMLRLPHNIKTPSAKADVEKYTERYLKQRKVDDEEWTPDWNFLPKELMPRKKRTCAVTGTKKKAVISGKDAADMLSRLDELAKKDGNPEKSDDETEKKENEEEEEIEEEDYNEEDVEETDYIESHFDNGEDFANSDDNVDAEATY